MNYLLQQTTVTHLY